MEHTEWAAGLEINRAIAYRGTPQTDNIWVNYEYFDQSLDLLDYSKKTGTSTKIKRWSIIQTGINTRLTKSIRLRLSMEQGSQILTRPIEPRRLEPEFRGGDIRIQWNNNIKEKYSTSIEVGYRLHDVPTQSITRLQQGKITATAAPGKTLFSTEAKDSGWLIGISASRKLSDTFTLNSNIEYRDIEVEAHTTSNDPLILSLLQRQQIPQTTPWKESHYIFGISTDWVFMRNFLLGMDLRHYIIARKHYIPRTNFRDYHQNTQFDAYIVWDALSHWSIFLHGKLTSHFILGELPLLYNRRNNHTFKNPFGILSIGIAYKN